MRPTLGSSAKPMWEKAAPGLLILLGLLVLWPGTAALPLLDRDEPRFAGATVEMIRRSEWIVPYFNAEYRFDKPVLVYWLMRAGYALFGIGELGARLPAVASAIVVALTIWHIGRRWFSARTGALAAFMWLCSAQVLIHGRLALADMPMVGCVVLAQAALFELWRGFTWPRFFTFWGSLGIGFLAKGPIAWAVPLVAAALYRWVFYRRSSARGGLKIVAGVALMLGIAGAWGIPALIRTGGEFWAKGMGEHVIRRGFEAFDGRRFLPFYYLPTALFSLFPWIAFLGAAWAVVRRRWNETNAWLVSWLVAPYLIFTFYSTQLPHYVLPGFPAFFLLLAQAFDGAPGEAPLRARWGRAWAGWVLSAGVLVVLAAIGAAGLAADAPGRAAELAGAAGGLAAVFAGLLLCTMVLAPGRRAWVAVAGVLLIAAGLHTFGAALRRAHPAVALGALCARMPADAPFVAGTYREPTLVFYGGRPWKFAQTPGEIRDYFRGTNACLAVTLEQKFDSDDVIRCALRKKFGLPAAYTGDSYAAENNRLDLKGCRTEFIEGVNVAKGQWVRLRVLRRGGSEADE